MTKAQERDNPNSCWNRAKENELLFIMMERDFAMPAGIIGWAKQRVRLGMNKPDDAKIREALKVAEEANAGEPRPKPAIPDGWIQTGSPKGSRGILQISEVCGLNASVCEELDHPLHYMIFFRNGTSIEADRETFFLVADALGFPAALFETAAKLLVSVRTQ